MSAENPSTNCLGFTSRLSTTPQIGFPSITPIFGGMFLPGGNATQLSTTDSWTAVAAQSDSLAASGFRLASFTALQSLHRTFFHAASEQATGRCPRLTTPTPKPVQQTSTAPKAGD